MKNNSEFKRKLVINKTQIDDATKRQANCENSLKCKEPKTMQNKNATQILNLQTPPMMTALSTSTASASASVSSSSSIREEGFTVTTSLRTKQITATATATRIAKSNFPIKQTAEETNILKEIQQASLQQQQKQYYHKQQQQQQQQQQQLQQTELKYHLQNNNDKIVQTLTAHTQATICNDIDTGNTLLSHANNNNNNSNTTLTNKNNNNNNDDNINYIYNVSDNNESVISSRVTEATAIATATANTSCSSKTSPLTAAPLSPSLIYYQCQKAITAKSAIKTTATTTNTFYKHSALYHKMANSLRRFKFWQTTSSATRFQTNKSSSNSSCYSSTSSNVMWLLALVSMFSLVGYGHAGFACLSNPCVFGVCIDGLNSSYSCYCIDGYTGIQCQTNWDECWSGPCENGGTCIDGVAYYNCTCPDGFSATN